MNKIITVAREFGSGGREFARRLAEELGFEYYDKEILAEIARHTEFSEAYVSSVVEKKPHSLFPISIATSFSTGFDYQLQNTQSIFAAQFDAIHELADKSDCVIVGRCADHILKDKDPFRIFLYANMQHKIERCLANKEDDESGSAADMEKLIKTLNVGRARYYSDYTGLVWGDRENYDLCINTSKLDIGALAKNIASLLRGQFEASK